MLYPKSLESLIENLKKLPGVGQKTAESGWYSYSNWSEQKDTL